jgi:alkylation response protein AidB-like acyl-CoA dehydrogenase
VDAAAPEQGMPDAGPTDHPLVVAAQRLATDLLEPNAADVDQHGVPRSHLDAIGAAGLLGLAAPIEAGGSDASADVVRAVAETLAGSDAATWFVQAQHHSPVRMLAAGSLPARDRYLRRLATGELLAGIAFSHLRRFPQRPVTASRTSGGWRFDGVAPWYTGWGLNDVAFVSGVTETDDVVFGIVEAREGSGLRVVSRLRTAALDAAQTIVLALDGVEVADADIALVQPHAQWLAADAATSANANPAIFGVARSGVRLLHETATARAEEETADAADALGAWVDDVRRRAYALADEALTGDGIDERLAVRAEALEAAIAVTSALVAANSGPAMAVSAAAQRKAREALFLLVQAQTAGARRATLAHWAASVGSRA